MKVVGWLALVAFCVAVALWPRDPEAEDGGRSWGVRLVCILGAILGAVFGPELREWSMRP